MLAVREALVNALCHRDYSQKSSHITVAIFDDRLEVWNSGLLPSTLQIGDLKKQHRSVPRNRLIANVFYDRKYFDGWGDGTLTIFKLCQEEAAPEPIFGEYSGGVSITFKLATPMGQGAALIKESQKVRLNQRQERILGLLRAASALSSEQILTALGAQASLRTVQADLQLLKKEQLINQIGKGTGVLWEIIP